MPTLTVDLDSLPTPSRDEVLAVLDGRSNPPPIGIGKQPAILYSLAAAGGAAVVLAGLLRFWDAPYWQPTPDVSFLVLGSLLAAIVLLGAVAAGWLAAKKYGLRYSLTSTALVVARGSRVDLHDTTRLVRVYVKSSVLEFCFDDGSVVKVPPFRTMTGPALDELHDRLDFLDTVRTTEGEEAAGSWDPLRRAHVHGRAGDARGNLSTKLALATVLCLACGVGIAWGGWSVSVKRSDDRFFEKLQVDPDSAWLIVEGERGKDVAEDRVGAIQRYLTGNGRRAAEVERDFLPRARIAKCTDLHDLTCLEELIDAYKGTEHADRAAKARQAQLDMSAKYELRDVEAGDLSVCTNLQPSKHPLKEGSPAALLRQTCKDRYLNAVDKMSNGPVRQKLLAEFKDVLPKLLEPAELQRVQSKAAVERHGTEDVGAFSAIRRAGVPAAACALLDDIARGRTAAEMTKLMPTFLTDAAACAENHLPSYLRYLDENRAASGSCSSALLVDVYKKVELITQGEKGPSCVFPRFELGIHGMAPLPPEVLSAWVQRDSVVGPGQVPATTRCFDEALRKDPTSKGTVRLRLEGSTEGGIKKATVTDAKDVTDPALAECLAQAVLTWRFPPVARDGLTFEMNLKLVPQTSGIQLVPQ